MRILHIIYDHPNNPFLGGGGAVRAWKVNHILAEIGHQITVVCGAFPGCRELPNSAKFQIQFTGHATNYTQSRLHFSRFALKNIAIDHYDLIVDDTSPYSWTAPWLRFPSKPRVALVHHLGAGHFWSKQKLLGIIPWAYEWLNLRIQKDIIAVSQSTALQVKTRNPSANIEIIEAGVDLPDQICETESNEILFLGRMDIYNKGIDLLLNWWERWASQHPAAILVMAGGGKDSQIVQDQLRCHPNSAQIRWEGRVEDERKTQLLSQCRFFIMPSRYEGWGMVAMEAAAWGKVVLGSDIPGLNEAVHHQETGVLLSLNQDQLWLEWMDQLWQDHSLRNQMGRRARLWAAEHSWASVAQRHLKFYQQKLDGLS